MVSDETKRQIADLLESLRRRPHDEKVWESLYGTLRSFVWAVAYRHLSGNHELAADATQETFFRLFRYTDFAAFGAPEQFLAYLVTLTRHSASDLWRKAIDLPASPKRPEGCESEITPEQVDRAKLVLARTIGQLDGPQRQLAELLMQGKTLSEIARTLGISYSAAGVRVHRLRQTLDKSL